MTQSRATAISIILAGLTLSGCTTLEGVWADIRTGLSHTPENDQADSLSEADIEELVQATVLPTEVKSEDSSVETIPTEAKTPDVTQTVFDPEDEPRVIPVSVENAHDLARVEPGGADYLGALQVYPFKRGALFQVYTVPEQVTDIALQPGEELMSVSAGDTVRWIVGDTRSGAGTQTQAHILVKPLQSGLSTNLVILTSKRTYYLELHARKSGYMSGVSWSYPESLQLRQRRGGVELAGQAPVPALRGASEVPYQAEPNIEALNFSYKIKGDRPDWRPVRAFDDGRKVYIQFPVGFGHSEAPPLFVQTDAGDRALVNYRVKGRYYVVDRLFDKAELRLGEKRQQVVRILRDDAS